MRYHGYHGDMDSEDTVICTLKNKRPFSHSLSMSSSSKLTFSLDTEPSLTIIHKRRTIQNTLHKIRYILVTYFGNVLCSLLNNVVLLHSNLRQKYRTLTLWIIQLFTGSRDIQYHYISIFNKNFDYFKH